MCVCTVCVCVCVCVFDVFFTLCSSTAACDEVLTGSHNSSSGRTHFFRPSPLSHLSVVPFPSFLRFSPDLFSLSLLLQIHIDVCGNIGVCGEQCRSFHTHVRYEYDMSVRRVGRSWRLRVLLATRPTLSVSL